MADHNQNTCYWCGNSILNPFQIEQSLKLDVFHHARVDTTYVGGITKVLEVMKIAKKFNKNTSFNLGPTP